VYSRIFSIKSPASGVGKVSEPRLSQVRAVRVDQCGPAVRAVEVRSNIHLHS
jgi:hypothetical protein